MTITYPLLLDGGLSNELERQGCDLNQKLWSAKLLESNPEAIILAHLAYLESGAECIITSSYQATLPGFMAIGYNEDSARGLILKSVQLANAKKPAWVSFSCKDGQHISDGTPIEQCAAYFADHPTVFAIGVNCTSPEFISALIRSIKTKSGNKKIVVYPNLGAVYHAESKTWSGLSDLPSCELMVKEWMDLGADIIGGCCGVGPEQIKAMGQSFP